LNLFKVQQENAQSFEVQNLKYNLALQKAVNSFKNQNKPAKVLDIGTGTGLLAMMGAKAGADCITACEVSFRYLVFIINN
jgi:methylase of polypeptide subunit release factors